MRLLSNGKNKYLESEVPALGWQAEFAMRGYDEDKEIFRS